MDTSDDRKIPPAYFHRPTFPYQRHHHQFLELSPHCPQHSGYLSPPNTHHHLQLSPNCPLHRHLLPPCPLHTSTFPPNNQFFSSVPLPQNPYFNPIPPEADASSKSEDLMMQDGNEEDEEEEEFIYVLTDEWKEFFAKSEAKRRLAIKQAKKKGKD